MGGIRVDFFTVNLTRGERSSRVWFFPSSILYFPSSVPRLITSPHETAMSQKLLEYLKSFLTPGRLLRMEEVLAERTRFVTVVLENVHRTQNASACLRNCEAFGVQDVHVIPNEAGFRINKDIAQGAARWLTVHRHEAGEASGTAACFQSLRERGYRIVAVSGHRASGFLSEYEPLTKTALVFGNEHDGLSESTHTHADEIRRLPMFGFTESYNLSVAVALSLSELLPRIRQSDVPWRLSPAEVQELRETWVRRSLGHRLRKFEREFHRRGLSASANACFPQSGSRDGSEGGG
jgi:tRNA (guanosine-2'-O-)-methyltransferase